MEKIPYYQVDVFSKLALSGNGLTVFTEAENFSNKFMLRITQEMRQFESIFIQRSSDFLFKAKVFTCDEELDFAGHPVLGAAGVVHDLYFPELLQCNWEFQLNRKTVSVETKRDEGCYTAVMNQGTPEFGHVLSLNESIEVLTMMNLEMDDLYPGLMPCVVSTGLPYVILPLQRNGLKAKITIDDVTSKMLAFGAKFIGTLEIPTLSLRTWDNAGIVEDIATGSLAGPCGSFLVKHGLKNLNEQFQLNQGGNLGRPSQLFIEVKGNGSVQNDVYVGGGVSKIGNGFLDTALRKSFYAN